MYKATIFSNFNIKFVLLIFLLLGSFAKFAGLPELYILPKRYAFAIVACASLLYISINSFKHLKKLAFNQIDIVLILLYLYFSLRFYFSPNQSFPETRSFEYILLFSVYLFSKHFARCYQNSHLQLYIVAIAGIGHLLLGIFQFSGLSSEYFHISTQLFDGQGAFGNYTVMLLPSFFASLFFIRSKGMGLIGAVGICLFIISMPIVQARTAWLASFAVTAVMLNRKYQFLPAIASRIIKKKALFIVIGSSLLVAALLTIGIYQYKADSAFGRVFIWKQSAELISQKPLFGYGANSFIPEIHKVQSGYFETHNNKDEQRVAGEVYYAFNEYIQFAVEYGLIGTALFLLLLVTSLKKTENESVLVFTAKAGIIAFAVCCCFSYPVYRISSLSLAFIFLGIVSSAQKTTYTLSLPKRQFAFAVALTGAGIATVCAIETYKQLQHHSFWTETANFPHHEREKVYAYLDQYLHKNPYFLYEYALHLYEKGQFQECCNLLQECNSKTYGYDVNMLLGHCYTHLHNYTSAEQHYQFSANLIPHKFSPRYCLLKLYAKTENYEKAKQTAQEITHMDIKVPSEQVDIIKTYAKEQLKQIAYE